MLQELIIKTRNEYLDFFVKLEELIPQDQALKQIKDCLFNLENGCACKRKGRYKTCGNQIQFYISNIENDLIEKLKIIYQTQNLKFEFLIS